MNYKGIHKLLSLVLVLVLALSTPSMLVADEDDSENGNGKCKLQGTWIYDFAWGMWSITVTGTGDNKGTIDWEFIGPSNHPEYCPGCYWTSIRGVWEKSGPETYEFTTQGYYIVDGAVTFTILNQGTMTLTECNTAEVNEEYTIFFYGTDEIYGQGAYPPGVMQRLLLHQPLPVQ